MIKNVEEKKGESYALVKIALEGFIPVGAYYGTQLMPQIEFLAIITLFSSILFFAATWYRHEFKGVFQKKSIKSFFAYTLFTAVIPYSIIFFATKYSTAIDSALLLQSETIYAAFICWYFLKERVTYAKAIGVALILIADLAILYKGTIRFSYANIAIAVAPIIFVFGNMIVKKLHNTGVSWAPVLLFRQFIGGIILLIISLLFEPVILPSSNIWLFLSIFGVIGFGVSKMFWQLALQRLDVSKLTALLSTTPVVSAIISFIWLGVPPTNTQYFAILLTVFGVGFLFNTTSKQWTTSKIQTQKQERY